MSHLAVSRRDEHERHRDDVLVTEVDERGHGVGDGRSGELDEAAGHVDAVASSRRASRRNQRVEGGDALGAAGPVPRRRGAVVTSWASAIQQGVEGGGRNAEPPFSDTLLTAGRHWRAAPP
jgi:hypothetical protein